MRTRTAIRLTISRGLGVAEIARAERLCGDHELTAAELEEAAARQSRERGDEREPDRDHADHHAGTEDRGEEQRGEDRGKSLHRVDDAHERFVDPAAEVAAE